MRTLRDILRSTPSGASAIGAPARLDVTVGDLLALCDRTVAHLNGIGIELIIKTFADNRILDHCTPVIFASNKAVNFYRKAMPEVNL